MNIFHNRFKSHYKATAGLAVSRDERGTYRMGTPGDPESIGVYNDVVDVWKALDEIDTVETEVSHRISAAA